MPPKKIMKITHVNPNSMHKNPAFSQAVMVADAKKIVYIGEQNGVDASGAVVGDDLESQTGIGDKTAD